MPMMNYGKGLNKSWIAGTWRVLLLKGTWAPDIDLNFVSDVSADESAGAGYVRKTLSGQTAVVDLLNDRFDHNADNLTWTALTCSDFRYAMVYYFGTVDADSILHSYYDFAQQNVTALDFIIKWNGAASNGSVFRGT